MYMVTKSYWWDDPVIITHLRNERVGVALLKR